MTTIIPPLGVAPIVDDNGLMNQEMRDWVDTVSFFGYIRTGLGSPEGLVEARVTALYMDTSGSAGSILYIKRDNDVGGDTTKGWILV